MSLEQSVNGFLVLCEYLHMPSEILLYFIYMTKKIAICLEVKGDVCN